MPGAALRCLPGLVLLLTVLLPPRVAPAQGLPEMAPLNPVSSSRSGLYFQPLREPAPGRWVKAVALDYGSSIEYNQVPPADYILDSELMRLTLALSRDLGSGTFLKLDAGLGGAYAGFMDGFLDWYHGALGIRMAERERRPKDRFLYEITLPDGRILERSRNSLFLEDTRIGLGYHLSPILQTVLTATLPTSTGPAGYGRGVPSVGLLNTLSTPMSARVYYEGSANLGYTPRHGALKEL
ncbi:MAG: DUF3187 family protein, partial [Gemmatimonadales bacterium]